MSPATFNGRSAGHGPRSGVVGACGNATRLVAQEVASKSCRCADRGFGAQVIETRNRWSKHAVAKDADTVLLERRLTDHLGASVSIAQREGGKGEMIIKYGSLDELDGLIQRLNLPD
ncbi:MAG: hypothetical protein CM15mP68_7700 [Pseudomonadota bacterium]|nr:MAG: hypothetical protein CM15mP68_7700 [Pseudomonadota bacterium]